MEDIKDVHKEGRKEVDKRLAIIEGHIKAVRKMFSENKGCMEIALQLTAVEKSVHKASIMLMSNHLDTCVTEAVQKGDLSAIDEMHKLMEMYL